MSSVTNRIKEVKQPKGGYVNPEALKEIELKDEKNLNIEENIHANIVGMAVDYLSRFNMGNAKEKSFYISLIGAKMIQQLDKANELLNKINGLDDESIISACKLVGYDVCYRASKKFFKPIENINPDKKTIENIRIMVGRTKEFLMKYGPVVDEGMTFVGGYTQTITSGDADFMTKDTLWDFKVSNDKPKSAHTLQLLVYYLLGIHSDNEKYSKIKNLGIFNPRLNKVFIIEVNNISKECIKVVENEVIGYNVEILNQFKENSEVFTVTDLTRILNCSRYKVMQLYSIKNLPLKKCNNKYVIAKNEFFEWIEQKREKEQKQRKRMLMFNWGITIIILIIIIILILILKNKMGV